MIDPNALAKTYYEFGKVFDNYSRKMLNYISIQTALLAEYLIDNSDIGRSERSNDKASVFSDVVFPLHNVIKEAQNIENKNIRGIVDSTRLYCEAIEEAREQIKISDRLNENISDKRELNVIKAILNVMFEISRSALYVAKAADGITQIEDIVKDAERQPS